MSLRIRVIVIVVMVIAICKIISLVSKKKIDYKYGFSWSLLAVAVSVLAIWPQILGWLAKVTGVVAPVNMLFFMGFIFSLAIIFSLSKTVSKLRDKVDKLTQELAILKKEANDK